MGGIVLLGLIAGLGTCLGALLVTSCGRLRPGTLSLLLGFAAGIMAAVIIFDLLPSSLRYGSLPLACAGFCAGTGLMYALDLWLNTLSPSFINKKGYYLKMGYLISTGIALHDFPEGLAIAAGFAAADKLGPLLVLAIGIHNIPEGMATAAPLKIGGLSARRVLAINALISLVTPLGVFVGQVLVESSRTFIGLLLSFAAGAMTYIVLHELVPESRRNSKPLAHFGIIWGLLLILTLNLIA
ncbi:ZIP family metal transporter [Pelotomaculum propionicicum]|uniref:Zinc transporter ZupT n=1 Tax=Pelotomaculum propionicicum TaxID=258475 RepID=A0A4Y7RTN9_9FIRM|nr:ZIP family metal transporter [Pelotomaculum propionicicum]NLI11829.1 ZIP family metal transporter [Peptococcaceae bacterium]TEB12241.1 Zinc transporter ZupT [Pelotomaculum propionicicum]